MAQRKLRYRDKFILIAFLFLFSLSLTSYFLFVSLNQQLSMMRKELVGQGYLLYLERLIEMVPEHKLLVFRFLAGNMKEPEAAHNLEDRIDQSFEGLLTYNKTVVKQTLGAMRQEEGQDRSQVVGPEQLQTLWSQIKQQASTSTPEVSDVLHNTLIHSLRSFISTVADLSALTTDASLETNYLIKILVTELPSLADNIPSLMELVEALVQRQIITDSERLQVSNLVMAIGRDLAGLEAVNDKFKTLFSTKIMSQEQQRHFEETLQNFVKAVSDYDDYVTNAVLLADSLPKNSADEIRLGNEALTRAFEYRDHSLQSFETLLMARYDKIQWQLIMVFLLTLASLLIAFISGVVVMGSLGRALKRLVDASTQLSKGDLSARVDATSNDEIGRVGLAFNDMAHSIAQMIAQLRQAGASLVSGSDSLALSANTQVTSMNELQATVQEIKTLTQVIVNTFKELADSIGKITLSAEDTSKLALEGQSGLVQIHDILQKMVGGFSNIASDLNLVRAKANEINSIIVTIAKVADQTNLLSLNAAVEAEREKEHGRGFVVIASEIRRLADQVAMATLNIEKMINETAEAVSTGASSMEGFTKEFSSGVIQVNVVLEKILAIITRVQNLVTDIGSVSQGMQSQSLSVQEINGSMDSLTRVSQHTGESIKELQHTADSFHGLAKTLETSVQRFTHIVD